MTARKGEHVRTHPFSHPTYHFQAQPKKRGKKGYYTGSRLEFLTGYCDEYNSLRGKDRHQFWFKLFTEWWKRYPWRLEDNEEPPVNSLEEMIKLAYVGDVGDVERKAHVEQKVRDVSSSLFKSRGLPMITRPSQRITSWFSYRASSRHNEHNTWTPLLKWIHKQSNPKPRCRTPAQQFMLEEPSIVNAAFVSKYGEGRGMERIERVNKRNELAKSLVTTTYKHLVVGLEARAKATHEREMKEWAIELDDIEQAEDVTLCVSYHHSLPSTNHTLQGTRYSLLRRPPAP